MLPRPERRGIQRDIQMSDEPVGKMSFEDAMKELESVVGMLEAGEVPLEDSVKLYERGAALKEHCQKKLAEAEEKVARITLDAEGRPTGTERVDAE